MRKTLFSIAVSVALFIAYLPFTVIRAPETREQCEAVRGVIAEVSSPCCEDIELRLQGDGRAFHVNRGLERGLELAELEELVGQTAEILVGPSPWTPFDPLSRRAPVAQITVAQELHFTVF
ncbi:MAG: hypothetical protein AAF690_03965 [Acidobacteriota bacterium]